jgi:nucleoside-diphosphate-sugar epimerase
MKVVVFGATGVTGRAAAEHFAALPGWSVVGVSRRPVDVAGVVHAPIDLTDRAACTAAFRGREFAGTTHVVYAALHEGDDLIGGWRDTQLMEWNSTMFRNAMEPLLAVHGTELEHVSLLQGGKAYGLHVGRTPVPAKERAPRDEHDNFYFLQEDQLRALASSGGWSWTILRPQVIYGQSFGSPMNLLPVIGVLAALARQRDEPLCFPGGRQQVHEAVDARLLARVLSWAATAGAARNEIFNVTNGDVFDWHETWPAIADAVGMAAGPPTPSRLAEVMPPRAAEWEAVVDRYDLVAPRAMAAFVGGSWTYADILFGSLGDPRPLPALMSTVKLRHAGFGECIDTEDMFREWLAIFQQRRLLPPR